MNNKNKIWLLYLVVVMIVFSACKKTETVPAVPSATPSPSVMPTVTTQPTATPTMEVLPPNTLQPTVLPSASPDLIVTNEEEIAGMTKAIMEQMTLEEKVGQLFIVNLELLDTSKGSFYEFTKMTKKMRASIEKYHVGGVILFQRNIAEREQTIKLINRIQELSKYPMFISVDEEGGDVARIAGNDNMGLTKFPTMEYIGKNEDPEYAYQMGLTIGKEIRELGFNLNFAPVADVRTNPNNTEIGERSFGSDPKLVADMVKAVVKGLQESNVSATLKHFPGHGDVEEDSHKGPVNVENDITRLREVEFVPFRAGIKQGADFIMVTHISISRVTESTEPSSLSKIVLTDMLRTEFGYKGIIITDALDMESITEKYTQKKAIVTSLANGSDIILMPADLEEGIQVVLDAVAAGTISEEKINESVGRILSTKIRRGVILRDTPLIKSAQPSQTPILSAVPAPSSTPVPDSGKIGN